MPIKFSASEKLARIEYIYKKLKQLEVNNGNTISTSEAKDLAEEFFTHCYHLKDWIKKERPDLHKSVEKYVSSCKALSISADYCNTFKHAGLNRKMRSDSPIEKVNQHTKIDLTPSGFITSAEATVTIGDITFRISDLALECIEAWKVYFIDNHIDIL